MNSVLPSGGTLPHSPKNNVQSNNLNNTKPTSPIKNGKFEVPINKIFECVLKFDLWTIISW